VCLVALLNYLSLSQNDVVQVAAAVHNKDISLVERHLSKSEKSLVTEASFLNEDENSDLIPLNTALSKYNYVADSFIDDSDDIPHLVEQDDTLYVRREDLVNLPVFIFSRKEGFGYTFLSEKTPTYSYDLVSKIERENKYWYKIYFTNDAADSRICVNVHTNFFQRLKSIEITY
jgi:hypothetical protein